MSLQEELLEEFKERLPELEKKVKTIKAYTCPRVSFPIFLHGVMEEIVWNTKKQIFIELKLTFAKKETSWQQVYPWNKDAVYCDDIDIVSYKYDEKTGEWR